MVDDFDSLVDEFLDAGYSMSEAVAMADRKQQNQESSDSGDDDDDMPF